MTDRDGIFVLDETDLVDLRCVFANEMKWPRKVVKSEVSGHRGVNNLSTLQQMVKDLAYTYDQHIF